MSKLQRLRQDLVSIADNVYKQQDKKGIDEIEKHIEIQVDFFAKNLDQTIKTEWRKNLESFFVNMNGVKKTDKSGIYKEAFFIIDDYPTISLNREGMVVVRGKLHFILLNETDLKKDKMEGILIW